MRLASVLALKQEMMELARPLGVTQGEILVRPNPRVPGFAAARAASASSPSLKLARTHVAPVVAFGVGPRRGRGDDFSLAVRVFAGRARVARPLVERLTRHERELDVANVSYRPRVVLRPGTSCGHFNISAGTLGGFVEDDTQSYILSNNHVLADTNQGVRGDEILSPGPIDVRGGKVTIVGHLDRWTPSPSARRRTSTWRSRRSRTRSRRTTPGTTRRRLER